MAHLTNQQVLTVVVPLEISMILLEKPTDDAVEICCNFLTECGAIVQELSPQGLNEIFNRLRAILHEGQIDKRVQYTIELLFATRKTNFAEHPAVRSELDLVEVEDQICHDISIDAQLDPEDNLNFFHAEQNFQENEQHYNTIRLEILGEETIAELEGKTPTENEDQEVQQQDEEDENGEKVPPQSFGQVQGDKNVIQDSTETDVVNLRRVIYLTIMSSVDFTECVHKLLKIQLKEGQEVEMIAMLVECCAQERSYMRFYPLVAQRFCALEKSYQDAVGRVFAEQVCSFLNEKI